MKDTGRIILAILILTNLHPTSQIEGIMFADDGADCFYVSFQNTPDSWEFVDLSKFMNQMTSK